MYSTILAFSFCFHFSRIMFFRHILFDRFSPIANTKTSKSADGKDSIRRFFLFSPYIRLNGGFSKGSTFETESRAEVITELSYRNDTQLTKTDIINALANYHA